MHMNHVEKRCPKGVEMNGQIDNQSWLSESDLEKKR